jgi:adenosylcobinamide kinase/adenosylcobinamide-phosphate guanylyltransferase
VLIGGGARSGKSRFALDYAEQRYTRRAFLATAQALDDEMRARIARHRAERGNGWITIEEPYDIASAIEANADEFDVIVVDCLTLWLSNIMLDPGRETDKELANLERVLERDLAADVVVITNEVGCGIVPDNPLGREYRDRAGEINQALARAAREVFWMVFGIPVTVKPPPRPL